MEIEIQNSDNRLKPGMYARVSLTVEERKNTLVAPKNAVIDFESKRGVWVPNDEKRAQFVPVTLGIEDAEQIEIHRRPQGRRSHRDDRRDGGAQQRSADDCRRSGATVPSGGPAAAGRRPSGAQVRRRRGGKKVGGGEAAGGQAGANGRQ